MIFVGNHSTRGYKLLDAVKIRVVISRDVIVDEIKELHQPVTGYIKVVIGYNFENSDSIETDGAETHVAKARNEENVRRSIRQIGLPQSP